TSGDYRYTRGGSPRSGFYWYWRLYTDQSLHSSAAMPLNGASGIQAATGSYYKPTYSALSSATNTLSNTATQSVFSVRLNLVTPPYTPLHTHQLASLYAQTEDIFTFTLDSASDVRLVVTMRNGGYVQFDSIDNGELRFGAYGSTTFHDVLPAGTYRLSGYL